TEQAVFDVVPRATRQGGFEGGHRAWPILRMDETHPPALPLRQIGGLDAVDPAAFIRGEDLAGEDVACPPPPPRGALPRLQPALAFGQPGEREDAGQGIGEAACDFAEQALLVLGPFA